MTDLERACELVEPNIIRGAILLDQFSNDWFNYIDTTILDISDPTVCILGQSFIDGINGYGRLQLKLKVDDDMVIYFGFCDGITKYDSGLEIEAMTIVWTEQINKRKAEAGAMAKPRWFA